MVSAGLSPHPVTGDFEADKTRLEISTGRSFFLGPQVPEDPARVETRASSADRAVSPMRRYRTFPSAPERGGSTRSGRSL
jgi:hypothetical protein